MHQKVYVSENMFAAALLLFSAVSAQQLSGDWPPVEKVPPVNADWTTKLTSGVQIPNLPVTTAGNPVWDTTGEIVSCIGNPTHWALTYDDGPSPFTELALSELAKKNIKATFFITGQQVIRFPAIFKKVFDAGHEIALHSWSHAQSTMLTNDQLIAEYVWTAKAMYQVIGKVPRYLRPPFGDMDARTKAVVKAMDLVSIVWNRESKDTGLTPQNITDVSARALNWTKEANPDGIVSLQHDLFENSAKAIGPVLDVVSKSSFKPVLMSECGSNQNIGPAYATSGKFFEIVTGSKTGSGSGSVSTPPSSASEKIMYSFALASITLLASALSV